MSATAQAQGFPRLEKYELLEEIGHGGMATVYRARDPRLGREVAIKIIHRHLRENAEVGTRFVAEARAAAKLHHPGIVEVFDVSTEEDAERYIVAELIRGSTLRKVLLANRSMPAEVGASIVLSLCEALEHAHGASIIHRDIKPENVLVELPADRAAASGRGSSPSSPGKGRGDDAIPAPTPSDPSDTQPSLPDTIVPKGVRAKGRRAPDNDVRPPAKARPADNGVVIKITDFGIAKILDAQGVTSTGQVLGSPAHMAPEQIEGGDVDERTDVFALGVLMYECLVGHLPFEGKNPAQVLRRVLEGSYPAADRERPAVGGRWSRILAQALAHDPAVRTRSPGELGEQIRAELAALGVADPVAEISAYFAAPAAYATGHPTRFVARLVARGEAARKSSDVQGAAADFNRALALAPHDLAILRRVAGLTASAGRKLLARRLGAILAGSVVLGLGAFLVARAVKSRAAQAEHALPVAATRAELVAAPAASIAAVSEPAPPPPSTASAAPQASAKRVWIPANPSFTLPPPPAPTVRDVIFQISPGGARLTLDGAPQPEWFNKRFPLATGPHRVEVTANGTCCDRLSRTIPVEAPAGLKPGDPVPPLTVPLSLVLKPAQVSLAAGAPPNAQLSCGGLGLILPAGATQSVKLPDAEWKDTCSFFAPGRQERRASVSLRAGESNVVPWRGE